MPYYSSRAIFDGGYGNDVGLRFVTSTDPIAQEVRALCAALGEDTATFAARWRRSKRTVEDWEQGRRRPDALALDGMRALAARLKKTKRAKKTR